MDMHNAGYETGMAENAMEIIRTHRIKPKTPDLPGRGVRQIPDELSGYRNRPDTSGKRTDGHSVANDVRTPANKAEMVRTCRNELETRNSPKTPGNGTLKSTCRWRIVSVHIINIYVLLIGCGPNSKLHLWTSRERRRGDCTKFLGRKG